MSQENVDVVKRVLLDGIDLVALFGASAPPDPSITGIDVTAFDEEFETEFIFGRHDRSSQVLPCARGGVRGGWIAEIRMGGQPQPERLGTR